MHSPDTIKSLRTGDADAPDARRERRHPSRQRRRTDVPSHRRMGNLPLVKLLVQDKKHPASKNAVRRLKASVYRR